MTEKVKARVLFVEDEAPVLKSLVRFFQQQGFEAYGARSSEEALDVAQNKKSSGIWVFANVHFRKKRFKYGDFECYVSKSV